MTKYLSTESKTKEDLSDRDMIKELREMNDDLCIDWTEQYISTQSIAVGFEIDHKKLVQYIDHLIKFDKRYSFMFFFQPHLNEYIMGPIAFVTLLHTYIGEEHYDEKMRYLAVMQSLHTVEPEWVYENKGE